MTVEEPVRAVILVELDEKSPPGAICYHPAEGWQVDGFNYKCPCGCGAVGGVRLTPGHPGSWTWDTNMLEPTVNPSIKLCLSAEDDAIHGHWHGWLRAGVWESC